MTALPLHSALDGDDAHSHSHGQAHALSFWKKYVFSVDHKIIGIQFLFLGLIFFVVGGALAMLVRWQLGWPDDKSHPVPVLGRLLWLKFDSAEKLGTIQSVSVDGTVVIGSLGGDLGHLKEDVRPDDKLAVKGADGKGEVPLSVIMVEEQGATPTVVAKVDTADPAALSSALGALNGPLKGASAFGRRMPGTMPPDFYTMAFSMHASIMIFFVIIPLLVGTFGNYLIPLKIGAGDMAFPFLNGMAFWSALPAGTIMVAGFLMVGGHEAAGWTVYPPLSALQQNKGFVPYEGPRTGWENFVSTLRYNDTRATINLTADKPAFKVGKAEGLAQPFHGDSAKVAPAVARALAELAYEDQAKIDKAASDAAKKTYPDAAGREAAVKKATEAARKGAPLAGLKLDSISSTSVAAILPDGVPLTAAVERDDAAGGTLRLRLGDNEPSAESITRRLDARAGTKLADEHGGASPWTTPSLLMTYFGWFMMFLYICAYYVHLVPEGQSGAPRAARVYAGPALFLLALALLCFGPGFRSTTSGTATVVVLVLLAVEGLVLMFGGGVNQHVSVALALVGGYFGLKFSQMAAFDGQTCWFLSLIILGFSSIMGAVNYLTTVVKLRCPGMTMFRLPLSVWSIFITSILVLLATPVLASVLTMNLLDHHRLTSFFLPFNWNVGNDLVPGFNDAGLSSGVPGGGFALLHQHLFWFYSHPAVYIMILPAMGMVSDIMAVFARKPIFGYRPMVYAMAGIAFLGFIVWAHHMFQSGMNPTLGTTFAVSTVFIAVPSAIKTFNWLGTLWGANIRFTAPMVGAIIFVAMFVIGGLSGIYMASTAVDVHIHDTYFIVAHIHYVLFGGTIFGVFASIYFWYPKMFGRMMNDKWGVAHLVLTFIFFNCTFFPMHILGIGGMARRIADFTNYSTFRHFLGLNRFISYSAFALGLVQIPFIINFIGSWVWGKKAPNNPWEATTLEWNDTTSPPPHGNFATLPVVHHGPYEYSTPLVEEDWLAQTRHVEGSEQFASVGH